MKTLKEITRMVVEGAIIGIVAAVILFILALISLFIIGLTI